MSLHFNKLASLWAVELVRWITYQLEICCAHMKSWKQKRSTLVETPCWPALFSPVD